MGVMVSPILGPAGNAEFLLHGIVGANPSDRSVSESLFDKAISAASELATAPHVMTTVAFLVNPARPEADVSRRARSRSSSPRATLPGCSP